MKIGKKICSKINGEKKCTPEECIDIINDYSIVSFDVFDTLIKRIGIEPKDIFAIVEHEYKKEWGLHHCDNFVEKRIYAETTARRKALEDEISIEDIYDELKEFFSSKERKWLLDKENEIEYRLCFLNPYIRDVYEYCKKKNKTIIITTDIYLHKNQIKKMLNKCGISEWSYLLVSSDLKKTKASGALFEYMFKELHFDRDDIVHIGDNRKSDFINAKKNGIRGILIPRKIDNLTYANLNDENINNRCVSTFINNTIINLPQSKRIGYECFGPLLYGFVTWVKDNLKKRNISDVFFLSRDGFIIKKAFDIINNDKNIKSHYFLASRKALRVPLLAEKIDFLDFINRNFWEDSVSTGYFLKEMGFKDTKGIDPFIDNNFCYSVNKKQLIKDPILKRVFEIAISKMKSKAQKEKEAFVKYANSMGLGNEKCAIVDIGWHGNMQVNIERLLDGKVYFHQLYGYYIGVIPSDNHHTDVSMKGFLFDDDENIDLYRMEADVNSLFEQVFMAPHGSVANYVLNDDGSFGGVEYCEYEQDDEESIRLLNDYQNGGLEFVRRFYEYSDLFYIDGKKSASAILNQFLNPTYIDACQWGNLKFKDSEERALVYSLGLFFYIFHPKKMLKDFRRSVWKEGFLKQTFKFNINYYKLIKLRQKIRTMLNKK